MIDIILDTLLDTLKLIPFLLIAFIIIEFIEHKITAKNKKILTKTKKYGPILGSLLGIIPQCGFSVMATNLYVTRIISLGTLIAIYLSTSDEMLPILISENAPVNKIITILLIKLLFAILYGIIIDLIISKKKIKQTECFEICEEEDCHCKDGIVIPAIKHTSHIIIFILIINFVLNILFTYIEESLLSKILLKDSIFSPFVTSLIGLIPNCGTSVILTELYLKSAIDMSSLISGLLTGSGTAVLILFKSNKNIKENISILLLLYILGALSGLIIQIVKMLI